MKRTATEWVQDLAGVIAAPVMVTLLIGVLLLFQPMLERMVGVPQRDVRLLNAVAIEDDAGFDCALADGATANGAAESSTSPTVLAAGNQSPRLLRELLRRGANPNSSALNGVTPLIAAVWARRPEAVKALLSAGADPNARAAGVSPITAAVSCGNTEVVALLLRAGADVHAADKNADALLRQAIDDDHREIAAILRRQGARLSDCTNPR
jgi:ankyrin repeat protein